MEAGYQTVEEAAELIGLSHWTVRRWLSAGRLTRYRSGSRVVVNRPQLLELVKPRKAEPNDKV